jgi:excisionase family DNA binding protein
MAEGHGRKLLLNYEQAAEFLNVSTHTVRRLAEAGELERIYVVPRSPRITHESLTAFLTKKRKEQGFATSPA